MFVRWQQTEEDKKRKTLPFTTDEESICWKNLRPRLADWLEQPFVFAVGSRGPEVTPLFAFLRIPQFFNAGEYLVLAINHFSFPSHGENKRSGRKVVLLSHPCVKKQRLEFANCSICFAFLRGAALGRQLYFFPVWEGKVIFFFWIKKKRTIGTFFVPLSESDACCWCWGYCNEQRCKFPYLAENMDSSPAVTRGSEHSTVVGPRAASWGGKQGRDSDSAGPLQGCAALNAALVRPARISLPPAAFTRLLSRRLGFTYLLRPRVHASGIEGSGSALRKGRCCLFCESEAPEGNTVPGGTVWYVELNGYQSIFSLALIFFFIDCRITSANMLSSYEKCFSLPRQS